MIKHFADYKKVFDIDINSLIYNILLDPKIQQEIIEYNQSQLKDGKDSNDQKIITIAADEQGLGNVYSLFTISARSASGLQTRYVDLNDTGAFYNSFFIKVTKNNFEILADFNKSDGNIMDNFNSDYDFLGLTEDNLSNFIWDVLYSELSKDLKRQLSENKRKL